MTLGAAFHLTEHAQKRMYERRIPAEDVLAALHKRGRIHFDGVTEHFDPRTQLVVKVNYAERTIITIYRRRRSTGSET